MPSRSRPPFPLLPRHRLSGLAFGIAPSKRRGRGTDVAGSRAYAPGDPKSAIDWRASARLSTARQEDQFVVRVRYADEAPKVVILCDRGPSMRLYEPPFPWLSKPAAAREAIEAIVHSALAARGAIGYLDYAGSDVRGGEPFWIPPRGRSEWRWIADRQVSGAGYDAPEDGLALGLAFLGRLGHELPSGTFVFVVSDFFSPPPAAAWIAAAARHWDIVPVVVQDSVWEQSFPLVGPLVLPLVDPRDGRVVEVRLTRREARARREANEAERAALLEEFAALGLDPVLLDWSDPAAVDRAFFEWAELRRVLRSKR